MRSAINTLLVVLSLMTALLISVSSYASTCPIGIERKGLFWSYHKYGNRPYICVRSCKYVISGVALCLPDADPDASGSCKGDFASTGVTCPDSDGLVPGGNFPEPDDGDDNGDGDGGGDGDDDDLSHLPADIRGLQQKFTDIQDDSFNVAGEPAVGLRNTQRLLANSSIIEATYSSKILEKLDELRTEHFADMDASLGTIQDNTNSIESKMNSISLNVNNMADDADQSANALNQISNKLDQLIENTKPEEEPDCTPVPPLGLPPPGCIPQPSGVEIKLDGISNTLINNGVNASLTGQEIKSSIDGLSNDLKDIKDALSDDGFEQRDPIGRVDFSENPLYDESKIQAIEKEVEELEKAYDEKVKQFQGLIGFDESKLNDGKYVNHALNFRLANGVTFTGVSSVLPALIDVSYWIANALLFMAVIIGLRQLGN